MTLARTSMEGKLRDIGNTKDKMLESDPNLEKNVMIHQDIEKMMTSYCKFYYEKF